MIGCLADTPDFAGQVVTKFYHGGVTSVEVTYKQSSPPKITERIKYFLERIFK